MYRQIIDFEGLKWSNISPTDIDMAVDGWGEVWIFTETKFGIDDVSELNYGQRKFIERLCDDLTAIGREAICYISKHTTPNEERVRLAETKVVGYYYKGDWRAGTGRTVKQHADDFMQNHSHWSRPADEQLVNGKGE
jgi:hypothetical protein